MLTDRSRNARTLSSSLAIATALVAGASPALAQSFQGNATPVTGAPVVTTSPGTTTVSVTADSILDWSTFNTGIGGGPINFQPAGTTATFQFSSPNLSILNRIIPADQSRAIQFNGTVFGQVVGASPTTGGTIYFYSPGGIILGSSAVFDVGNLGLTSSTPQIVGGQFEQTNPVTGQDFVNLTGATAGTGVTIQAGAVIRGVVPTTGSYVALIAPVVNNAGTIQDKRATALVSADAATLTFNPNGLFDIQVTSGTSGTGSTLINSGSITGPAGDAGFASRIYMVAVPKNQAITMAITAGSTLGFDVADAADVVGNAIVLSAGQDIFGGNVSSAPSSGGGTGTANISIDGATLTSALTGRATGNAFAFSQAGSDLSAASNLTLAGVQAKVSADGAGSTTTIAGPVTLSSDAFAASGNATGGTSEIFAINGGQVTINSAATLNARGFGGSGTTLGSTAGTGTGGIAIVQAQSGGDVAITGNVTANAIGTGGAGFTGGGNGGNGVGGRAQIFARDSGSSVTIGGSATAFGGGIGGNGAGSGTGGTGIGGQSLINTQVAGSATLSITGNATATARGTGGNGADGGAGTGGVATGAASAGNTLTVGGTFAVDAQGTGGNATGGIAGTGTGGTAQTLLFTSGTMNVTGALNVNAQGLGGTGTSSAATNQGGTATVQVQQASSLSVGGNLFIGANATGQASGAAATGGAGSLLVSGGSAVALSQSMTVQGIADAGAGPGAGGTGGIATGGTATLTLNGGTVSSSAGASQFTLEAQGFGGDILAAQTGTGGSALGGTASLNIAGGTNTLTFSQFSIDSDGQAGNNFGTGNGGAGVGGISQVSLIGGSLVANVGDAFLESDGEGGDSLAGTGGAGNGGRALVAIDGGTATFNGNVSLSGESEGGDGVTGGAAFGDPESNISRAFVFARNGSLTITGSTFLNAAAFGGSGSGTGNGGAATGGFGNVLASNNVNTTGVGTISLGDLSIDASGVGGDALGTGNGGAGSAGRAHLFVNGGNITVANVDLFSVSFGGTGLNGGDAISNNPFRQPRTLIGSFNGTIGVSGAASLTSAAVGGDGSQGGTGGIAFAGVAGIEAQSNNGPSAITLTDLDLDASAFGGAGGDGGAGQTGGAGGDAYGSVTSAAGNAGQGTLTVTGTTSAFASAFGGAGGIGGTGATGAAGGAGGRAFGGGITLGTVSGVDTVSNSGSATFTSVNGTAIAIGGNGGDGGSGTTQGVGGKGGLAYGGTGTIISRGSPATFDDVSYDVTGFGGAGGLGSTQGNGGDGYGGDTNIIVTQRFNRTERGTLVANDVSLFSSGVGGAGAVTGNSYYAAAADFEGDFFVRQSDVTIGNLNITHSGTLPTNFTGTILAVADPMVSGIPVPTTVTVTAQPFDIELSQSNVDVTGAMSISVPGDMRISLDSSTLDVGDLSLDAGNFVLPAVRPATLGTINVANSLLLSSNLDFLAYANFNVGFAGTLAAGGSVLTGDLTFNGDLDLSAAGSITTGNVTASNAFLTAGQGITTLAVNANGTIDLKAGAGLSSGNLTAGTGNVLLSAPGAVSAGAISARQVVLGLAGTSFTSGAITTTATSGGRVYIANSSMDTPTSTVASILATSPPVAVNGPIAINGAVTTDLLQASTQTTLNVTGAITARAALVLNSGGNLTTANVTAGDLAVIASTGAVTVGNVDVGLTLPGSQRKLFIAGAGAVNAGSLSAGGDLGVQSQGTLSTGALRGRDVVALAGSTVSTGAISALNGTQPVGRVYIGNVSQGAGALLLQPFSNAAVQTLFGTSPVKVGGSITIGGAVASGSFTAATSQAFTGQAMNVGTATSGFLDLRVDGLVTVNGAWRSSDIDIRAGDIAIPASGSMDALSAAGEVQIAAANGGALIGDGLSGSGFALSNDEFSRIKAGEIAIFSQDTSGAVDMTIGNLSINASQLYGSGGLVVFATGDLASETPSGTLRINGAITATGLTSSNEVDFYADTVELEAATGSIKLGDSGTGLGGLLYVEAKRLHVASDAILTKLRADPHYAGHIAELNAPASVQRPDGVFNALGLELNVTDAILIQNTGTSLVPAGFVTTLDATDIGSDSTVAPGSFELVLNGQLVSSTGTLTGRAAYDAAISQAKADAMADGETFGTDIAPGSTFNGCEILGTACSTGQSETIAPPASEITVVTHAGLDDSPVAPTADDSDEGEDGSSEEKKDEDSAEDEGSSPIAPPTPLISTRALDGDVNVVEPVSGAGNPALFGSVVNETTAQGAQK